LSPPDIIAVAVALAGGDKPLPYTTPLA
jgi:hypothetical protein